MDVKTKRFLSQIDVYMHHITTARKPGKTSITFEYIMEMNKIPTIYAHGTNFGPELQENLFNIFEVLYNAGRIKSIQKHRYLSDVLGNAEQVAFCDAYLLKKELEQNLPQLHEEPQEPPRKRRM